MGTKNTAAMEDLTMIGSHFALDTVYYVWPHAPVARAFQMSRIYIGQSEYPLFVSRCTSALTNTWGLPFRNDNLWMIMLTLVAHEKEVLCTFGNCGIATDQKSQRAQLSLSVSPHSIDSLGSNP